MDSLVFSWFILIHPDFLISSLYLAEFSRILSDSFRFCRILCNPPEIWSNSLTLTSIVLDSCHILSNYFRFFPISTNPVGIWLVSLIFCCILAESVEFHRFFRFSHILLDCYGFLRIFEIISNSLQYLRNLVKFSHINSYFFEFSLHSLVLFRILADSFRSSRNLGGFSHILFCSFRFCGIFCFLSDSYGFFKILSYSLVFSWFILIHPDFLLSFLYLVEFSRILSDSCRFIRILWN